MARTLAGRSGQTANNFQTVRTLAAVAVIVSHGFALASGVADDEPFNRSGWTPGACAVIVFFAISGYLIAGSFERRPDFASFAIARARRLFPAYLAALLLVVIVFGAVATRLDLHDYYTHPATWRFLAHYAVLDTSTKALPGVFADNPHPWTVNGSLWSLPMEVMCYMLLYGAGRLGLLKRQSCGWFFVVGIGISAWMRIAGVGDTLPHVLPSFLTGLALYRYRDIVPASAGLFLLSLGLLWIGRDMPLHPELTRAVIAYGAIAFATEPPIIATRAAGGDYSYGLYLYGWPTTQMIAWARPGIDVGPLIVLALAGSALLAVASWHGVERPAIRRRSPEARRIALPA